MTIRSKIKRGKRPALCDGQAESHDVTRNQEKIQEIRHGKKVERPLRIGAINRHT